MEIKNSKNLQAKLVNEVKLFVENPNRDRKLHLALTPDLLQLAYDVYFSYSEYISKDKINELTRYSSWDICFKHFEVFFKKPKPHNPEDLKIAGLYLGYYLASWGMFRNPLLLNYGIGQYESIAIKLHEFQEYEFEEQYKQINDFLYSLKLGTFIIDEDENIINNDKIPKPTDTLITKIMLGVYSNTPAFDRFFKKTVSKTIGKWERNLTLEQKIKKIFAIKVGEVNLGLEKFIEKKLKRIDGNLKKEKILDAIFFEIGRALFKAEKIKSSSGHLQ